MCVCSHSYRQQQSKICCSLFENHYNPLVLLFFTGNRTQKSVFVYLKLCPQPVCLSSLFFFFFFLQHFLMTAVCVCIGSAFCSTGCLKPTFSTAAGRVLHCFNLLQNGLIFLTENTGNNPQPLAPRNSGLSGICMNI